MRVICFFQRQREIRGQTAGLRILVACALCTGSALLAAFGFVAPSTTTPVAAGMEEGWSIVRPPNSRPTPTDNFPFAVACVTASDCWAVGYYNNVSAYQTLIEHWDGAAWAIVDSPNTNVTQHNLLRGVECESSSDCWAVGSFYNGSYYQTLTEHWDGASWSIVSSPSTSDTQYNYLLGVSCNSGSDCWAVGSYSDDNGTPQTLTEHWDGSAWTIITSPNTSASKENILNAVNCVSASDCWSAGSAVSATLNVYQTLIEHWDGSAWTIVTSPNTLVIQNNYLNAVTCVSASQCWTVGYSNNGVADQTLIERWDGTSWTIASSANTQLTQNNRLYAVACATSSECSAVGYSNNGSTDQNLVERWDGSTWAMVNSPEPVDSEGNGLKGVSCVGSTCAAVGFYNNGNVQRSLIERWDGSAWGMVDSPNNSAAQNNTLLGIRCLSESECWAVASYFNGSVQQTLIEHWTGDVWEIVESPNTSAAESNILYDIACPSAADCWTVGYHFNGAAFQTLVEHWNGEAWSIMPSPSTSAVQNNFLNDVMCNSASDCWAIGFYNTSGDVDQTLIEHWDGNSWTIISSPNTSASQKNRLYGLTCSSESDCWAVGRYFNPPFWQTLIEHWDGTSWSIVASPNISATSENVFWGVTCTASSDCWAVGSYGAGDGTGQPLIERWDGTSWTIAPSPLPTNNPQYNYNFLRGITCTGESDCWAVGYSFQDGVDRSLIEHWDGTAWSIVSSPNTSATQNNFLFGITCVSTSDCWASGYYYADNGVIQTLTQHYKTNLPVTLTNVISRKVHGAAGAFDVDLPLAGNPGIENRSGSASGDHQIVFNFAAPITALSGASVTPGTGGSGNIAGAPIISGTQVTINLTNVSNAQTLTVNLLGVSDGTSTADVSVPISVLIGDTNADHFVDSADIGQTKSQSGHAVSGSNFREDLNGDGFIDSADIGLVKSKSGTALP